MSGPDERDHEGRPTPSTEAGDPEALARHQVTFQIYAGLLPLLRRLKERVKAGERESAPNKLPEEARPERDSRSILPSTLKSAPQDAPDDPPSSREHLDVGPGDGPTRTIGRAPETHAAPVGKSGASGSERGTPIGASARPTHSSALRRPRKRKDPQ